MHRAIFSWKPCSWLVLASVIWLSTIVPTSSLKAQATCQCVTTAPFGSCLEKKVSYSDLFPGAAAVVPVLGKPASLFVADLYSGFTYRYDAAKLDTVKPGKILSPKGSNATTGLTYRQTGANTILFWAIEDKIYSTDPDVKNVLELGTVQLDKLASLLATITNDASITKGALGGITNHASRGTLWGVDIVNDVYFEFHDNGELVQDPDGKPHFFFNPKRNKLTGGAYGNSIAFVESGGREYFDVLVGSLGDRKPTEVHRFHAADGAEPETFKIGDPTGSFYVLGAEVGSPKFATGIAFWPNSCAANQSSEIVLDLDSVGGQPKVLQISADEPSAANIASFNCVSEAATDVTLTWTKTKPYTTLTITRQSTTNAASPAVTVFQSSDFANDPGRFVDSGVLDGSYEYSATVTAASAVPPVTCRISLGVGSLVAYHRFTGGGKTADPTPYAITVVNSETVLVADLNTGDAEQFDINLNPTGVLAGPIHGSLTVGLAWDSDSNDLYWLEYNGTSNLLHITSLTGERRASAILVDSPLSFQGPTQLAEISYDTVSNFFWTVDLFNNVIYGITPLGTIPSAFASAQIKNPETGGILSGGIAVAAAAETTVTLDIPIGKQATGIVDQVGRYEYTRANLGKKDIRHFDLRAATGASDFGGVEIAAMGTDRFEFAVGIDTQVVYKIRVSAETSGLITFRRGDVNNDGVLNISDPSALLSNLFKGGAAPLCLAAADADDSDVINIGDAVYLFNYLFKGGAAPPAPFSSCGIDTTGTATPCASATCTDA